MWGYSALRSIYMWQDMLKGTLCGAVRPTLKQTLKKTRSTCFCSDRSCRSDFVWTRHTIPFFFRYPTSLFPFTLSLHASPAPSFILPSSVSLFYIPVSFPPVHSTLPHGVRGWRPVLTASYLTFSPLMRSNRQPSQTKSCRFTPPLAEGSTGVRGWLHLQTSGYNGLVHLTS